MIHKICNYYNSELWVSLTIERACKGIVEVGNTVKGSRLYNLTYCK